MKRLILLALLAVALLLAYKGRQRAPEAPLLAAGQPAAQPALKTDYLLTELDEGYAEVMLHGWQIRVSRALMTQDSGLLLRVLNLLDRQLEHIRTTLPAAAVSALQDPPIWLELQTPGLRGAQYHWSADWLSSHGYHPRKARAVEIASAGDYLMWSQQQPSIILHELSHAYHDRVLGRDYAALHDAFALASGGGLYQSVSSVNGPSVRAYALTNAFEYFAELSEAYFARNDFFPYTREELRRYDATGFSLIERAWGVGG